jgi:site-specific DNA recombinase
LCVRIYRNIKDWVTIDELDVDVHLLKEGMIIGPSDRFFHGIPHYDYKKPFDILAKGSDSAIWQPTVEQYVTWISPPALAEIDRFMRNSRLVMALQGVAYVK